MVSSEARQKQKLGGEEESGNIGKNIYIVAKSNIIKYENSFLS